MNDTQRKSWLVVLLIGACGLLGGAGYAQAQARDGEAAAAESLQEARELYERASALFAQGAYAEAIAPAARALAIQERVLGPDHLTLSHTLWRLGMAYHARGDQGRAESLLARGLAITEQALGPDHVRVASFLVELARIYHAMSDRRAVKLLTRALALRKRAPGDHHLDVARVLTQLGEVYTSQKRYAPAQSVIQEALDMMKALDATGHPFMSIVLLVHAGWLENAKDAHREAIAVLERALAIQDRARHPNRDWIASIHYALGRRYYSLGEFTTAEPYFMETLAHREAVLGRSHRGVLKVMRKLMQASWARGDTARAVDWLSALQEARAAELDRVLEVQSEEGMTHYLSAIDREADQALQLALERGDERATRLAWNMMLGRKGRVLQVMASTLATLRSHGGAGDQALLDTYRELHTRYANEVMRGTHGVSAKRLDQRLRKLLDQRYALDKRLSARGRQLAPLPPTPTIDALQAALPRGAVFVDWMRYKPFTPWVPPGSGSRYGPWHYAACVLAAQGPPTCTNLGDTGEIDAMISALRAAIVAHLPAVEEHARALYDRLLAPLPAYVRDAEHLFLAPDGALQLVPFAALMDERGRLLVERSLITHVLDGGELLRPASTAPARSPALVVAAPEFGTPHPHLEGKFRYRYGLGREGDAIRELLDADLLTGAQATEERLKAVRGPAVLHLATHGSTDWQGCSPRPFLWQQIQKQIRKQPQGTKIEAYAKRYVRIGVALAGVNTCPLRGAGVAAQAPGTLTGDGWLSAPELSTLDLHGTRLVVLSAGETGEGRSNRDAGFFGLRRALVIAGAETHMVSLWNISDRPTQVLMESYYRELVQGAGRSEALREAQLDMLRKRPALRQRPFYWAGFIVSGNPAPL